MARVRSALVERLRARSAEIEAAIFARLSVLAEAGDDRSLEYTAEVRHAVPEFLDYCLRAIEQGDERSQGPIPSTAVAEARRAAHKGISLDTLLRRHAAADRVLAVFVIDEAEDLLRLERREVQRVQGVPVDHLMASVAFEYEEELGRMRRSPNQRLGERVRRLLAGELEVDPDLPYAFDAWHLGMIVRDAAAVGGFRAIAKALDCQLLVAPDGEDGAWLWLGRRRRLAMSEIEELTSSTLPEGASLALGESRHGLDGWRLTHREAQAASEAMIYRSGSVTRCRDVVLIAAVMRDDALAASLIETYLTPLDGGRGERGVDLRRTLREYLAAGQNASTAAAALSVNRHTVQRRLRTVEDRLGQRIEQCHAELQVALRVEEILDHHPAGSHEGGPRHVRELARVP